MIQMLLSARAERGLSKRCLFVGMFCLFVSWTHDWKRTAPGSFRACSQNTDNTLACFTRCKVYAERGEHAWDARLEKMDAQQVDCIVEGLQVDSTTASSSLPSVFSVSYV